MHPNMISGSPTRRAFLAAAAGSGVAAWATRPGGATEPGAAAPPKAQSGRETGDPLAFFVIGDTHYLANREAPAQLNERSATLCQRLVETLNRLPGSPIPDAAGGGRVATPRGVIHAGDIIDTGDKQGPLAADMQRTEWAAFTQDYGLAGGDGRLRYPVREVYGNHDAPQGKGWVLEQLIERNRRRPGLCQVSANGVHYSWDWGDLHFVNVGLIVGAAKDVTRQRRYAALDSLEFLTADLRQQVGDSGRPVVITHHVDIARYTGACDLQVDTSSKEWDPCDVQAYHRVLQPYQVAGIFYGHTHARNIFRWDGQSAKAVTGRRVFNTDNASHFASDAQAFLYVEWTRGQLTVREYQTKDGWETGFFTPQVWSAEGTG